MTKQGCRTASYLKWQRNPKVQGGYRGGRSPRQVRAQPNRRAAHRQRPHGAVQLAVRQELRRQVRRKGGGHRPGTVGAGGHGCGAGLPGVAEHPVGRGPAGGRPLRALHPVGTFEHLPGTRGRVAESRPGLSLLLQPRPAGQDAGTSAGPKASPRPTPANAGP